MQHIFSTVFKLQLYFCHNEACRATLIKWRDRWIRFCFLKLPYMSVRVCIEYTIKIDAHSYRAFLLGSKAQHWICNCFRYHTRKKLMLNFLKRNNCFSHTFTLIHLHDQEDLAEIPHLMTSLICVKKPENKHASYLSTLASSLSALIKKFKK